MRLAPAITIVALALAPFLAWAGGEGQGGCCPHCGCQEFESVCRIVPEIKKIPKVEYTTKCEEFCVPGRSRCLGHECVTDCDGNTCRQKVFEPTCGKVYKRVTPVKTTTFIEKCSYKCVVEHVCCNCGASCGAIHGAKGPPAPDAP